MSTVKDSTKMKKLSTKSNTTLPETEAVGIGAAVGWGIFLTGAESSRGIGVIFNFPGVLLDFALIAYRLFWNQFQTYNEEEN